MSWPYSPSSIKSLRWRVTETCLIGLTHVASRIYLRCFQKVQTKNLDILRKAVVGRSPSTPLVTVSNHKSCIDDPVIWGLLPFHGIFREKSLRWIPAAKEVCFINKFVSALCVKVRLVPVERGQGVYQKAISYCTERLNECEWVHIFPEGKVNVNGDNYRMKWGLSWYFSNDHIFLQVLNQAGVGQLIAEAKKMPTVIPFYHFGMDDILPNCSPYIPKFFQKLTILVGEPIDFSSILEAQDKTKKNAVILRRQITDLVQDKLLELKAQAEALHIDWNPRFSVWHRTL